MVGYKRIVTLGDRLGKQELVPAREGRLSWLRPPSMASQDSQACQ
jgi:hypothetical protein